jgi:hypothetical protein
VELNEWSNSSCRASGSTVNVLSSLRHQHEPCTSLPTHTHVSRDPYENLTPPKSNMCSEYVSRQGYSTSAQTWRWSSLLHSSGTRNAPGLGALYRPTPTVDTLHAARCPATHTHPPFSLRAVSSLTAGRGRKGHIRCQRRGWSCSTRPPRETHPYIVLQWKVQRVPAGCAPPVPTPVAQSASLRKVSPRVLLHTRQMELVLMMVAAGAPWRFRPSLLDQFLLAPGAPQHKTAAHLNARHGLNEQRVGVR